jgi:hypothetical protein
MFDTQNIKPDLMVHAKGEGEMKGVPGIHIGTVDHLDGDYIKLKKSDSSDGLHHWIPLNWVEKANAEAVFLNKSEDEVRAGMFDQKPIDMQEAV